MADALADQIAAFITGDAIGAEIVRITAQKHLGPRLMNRQKVCLCLGQVVGPLYAGCKTGFKHRLIRPAPCPMATPPGLTIMPVNFPPRHGFGLLQRHRHNPAVWGRTRRMPCMGALEPGPY